MGKRVFPKPDEADRTPGQKRASHELHQGLRVLARIMARKLLRDVAIREGNAARASAGEPEEKAGGLPKC